MLGAGSRPVEVAAQTARLAGVQAELRQLDDLQARLTIVCPAGGIVTTPRLREKIGHYVGASDLICVVEEPERLEVEVALPEEKASRVAPGQVVALKPRALAFETHTAVVDRVTTTVGRGDAENSITVYCRLEASTDLRPGMTGHARVYTGRALIRRHSLEQVRRTLRAELWR